MRSECCFVLARWTLEGETKTFVVDIRALHNILSYLSNI